MPTTNLNILQLSDDAYDPIRYPCPKEKYSYTVGETREQAVADAFNEIIKALRLPWHVFRHDDVHANGLDCVVATTKGFIGIEIMNEYYRHHKGQVVGLCYINEEKARRMRTNLDLADYPLIITSWAQCLSSAKEILDGIPIIDLGHQEIPMTYFSFFKDMKKPTYLQNRMISGSKKTKALMKIKILEFILHNKLLPNTLVYFSRCRKLLECLEAYVECCLRYYVFGVGESVALLNFGFRPKGEDRDPDFA